MRLAFSDRARAPCERVARLVPIAALGLAAAASTGLLEVADPEAETLAEWIAAELATVEWGARYPASGGCEPYRSTAYLERADQQYCYRCRIEREGASLERFYYAFDDAEPRACRLEQVRGQAHARDPGAVHAAIVRRIDALHGAHDVPEQFHDLGSAGWREVRRWQPGTLELLVYIAGDAEAGAALGLRARTRHLRAVMTRGDELYWQRGELWTSELDRRLAVRLRSEAPGVAAQLTAAEAKRWPELGVLVQSLVAASAGAAQDLRAAQLLAADRLAARLRVDARESASWSALRAQLTESGLGFTWSELGGEWAYGHELLRRVWSELPDTEWGAWAGVILLDRGWDTSPFCATSERFHLVIEHGERMLAEGPAPAQRARVLLAVAEAYETWFSLAHADPSDEYADAETYAERAEDARAKAIGYYEELFRLAPESAEAAYAGWALPRLRLGVATGQRRYHCIYD